jgi:hypothetical protein
MILTKADIYFGEWRKTDLKQYKPLNPLKTKYQLPFTAVQPSDFTGDFILRSDMSRILSLVTSGIKCDPGI